jgi:hypothetical protein
MGLFDLFGSTSGAKKPALEAAQEGGGNETAVTRFVQKVLGLGLDGKGPLGSATELGRRVRARSRDDDDAINQIVRQALVGGGIGGFATGVGGFVTMPVAIPVNVAEFYIQATRMVGAIAVVRGYDLSDPTIRTAVLLTLAGSGADEVLKTAGVSSPTGRLVGLALKGLPPEALMMINKAVGVRLLRSIGQRFFSRLGRGVPIAGGAIGGVLDAWMMKRIADAAQREFPRRTS